MACALTMGCLLPSSAPADSSLTNPRTHRVNAPIRDLESTTLTPDGVETFIALHTGSPNYTLRTYRFDKVLGPVQLTSSDVSSASDEVRICDLNRDNRADVILGVDGSMLIWVLGQPDGTFGPMRSVTLGGTPNRFAVGDINGDGNLDVATTTSGAAIGLVRGDGLGGLTPIQFVEFSSTPSSVALDDLDNDGRLDLIASPVASPLDLISVRGGLGNWEFGPAHSMFLGNDASVIATLDVSGDGLKDIMAYTDNLEVLINTGGLNLAAPVEYDFTKTPTSMKTRDVNRDGLDDLLLDSLSSTTVFFNRGDGTFQDTIRYLGSIPTDANLDGREDWIGIRGSSGTTPGFIAVAEGQWDGTPAVDSGSVLLNGSITITDPGQFEFGDINSDGLDDIALIAEDDFVRILARQNTLQYVTQVSYFLDNPMQVELVNVTGNERLDMVIAMDSNAGGVAYLAQLDAGGFVGGPPTQFSSFPRSRAIAVADLNNDTFNDVMSVSSTGVVSIALNAGTGSFPSTVTQTVTVPSAGFSLHTGDFEGDGDVDIFVRRTPPINFTILLNDGTGNFSATAQRGAGVSSSTDAVVADFDGNGISEIVAAQPNLLPLVWWNGAENPVHPPDYVQFGVGAGFGGDLLAEDINGDGLPDLIAAEASATFFLWKGSPNGLLRPEAYSTYNSWSFGASDMDGDGDLDVVVSTRSNDRLAVHFNRRNDANASTGVMMR